MSAIEGCVMNSGIELLTEIGIRFSVSVVFGYAALKIYDLFLKALKERNRIKLWWAFTSAIFLLVMIIFLSNK